MESGSCGLIGRVDIKEMGCSVLMQLISGDVTTVECIVSKPWNETFFEDCANAIKLMYCAQLKKKIRTNMSGFFY